MSTLNTDITAYRGNAKHVSQLRIGDQLYKIKDPAVEQLASYIDTIVNTPGSITIRTQAYDSGLTAYNFLTRVTQDVNGQITAEKARPNTGDIISTTAVGDSGADSTLADILSNIIGAANDQETAQSIAGAKKYAYNLVNTLSSEGVAEAAQKIQTILDELNDDETGATINTIVDKLRDVKDSTGNSMNVGAYVTSKIDSLDATVADGDQQNYDGTNTTFAGDIASFVKVQVTQADGKLTAIDVQTNDIAKATELTELKQSTGTIENYIPEYEKDDESETLSFTIQNDSVIVPLKAQP